MSSTGEPNETKTTIGSLECEENLTGGHKREGSVSSEQKECCEDDKVSDDGISKERVSVVPDKDLNVTSELETVSMSEKQGKRLENVEEQDRNKNIEGSLDISTTHGENIPKQSKNDKSGLDDAETGAAAAMSLDLNIPEADDQAAKTLSPEGSISSDASSEYDIEADVAIVTEEKTKKAKLAAVVKDEHGEGKLLVEALSDASRFSYCSVCAVSLGRLFENDFDKNWREQTIKMILDHLKLPSQCGPAMNALMSGMGSESLDAFVDTLRKDPVLKNNPLLLPEDLVTLSVQNGGYDARMRVLIFHVAWHLRIRWKHLEKFEEILVRMLKEHEEETEEQKVEREKKEKKKKRKRYALIGLATVGGGAAIGLTAGLAAPFIAAGLGAIIGTSAAAALTTTAGIAIMTSLFGAAGAGLTGYKMKKRVGAIEQFEFCPITHGNHLHVTIAISGWLSDEQPDNFHSPWLNLAISKEQYYLKWESKYLIALGNALEYLLQGAVTMATQEALKHTILAGLLAALTWPATVLSVAGVIDNPWGVAMQRAKEVGQQLAEVLISKQQGNRPVTLIGFSLGAKVIYNCLEELSKRKGTEGLLEDVILLGTPVPASPSNWQNFSRVVAGRIINGYCSSDWLLRFVYRTASAQISIAGLQPIAWDDRRMINIDLSDVVSGHLDYSKKMDTILKIIGVSINDTSSSGLVAKGDKKEGSSEETKKKPILEVAGVTVVEKTDVDDVEVATEALDDNF
ncbi:transmembrane and coiled-coil domain-containing protein 4-like [Glandiceps talaboti]